MSAQTLTQTHESAPITSGPIRCQCGAEGTGDVRLVRVRLPGRATDYGRPEPMCAACRLRKRGSWAYAKGWRIWQTGSLWEALLREGEVVRSVDLATLEAFLNVTVGRKPR